MCLKRKAPICRKLLKKQVYHAMLYIRYQLINVFFLELQIKTTQLLSVLYHAQWKGDIRPPLLFFRKNLAPQVFILYNVSFQYLIIIELRMRLV